MSLRSLSDSDTVVIFVVIVVLVPLWDVEHVLWFWSVKNSSINGPQSTEDPEQRTLPTAIWTCDQHVHPFIHLTYTHTHTHTHTHTVGEKAVKSRKLTRWMLSHECK